MNFVTITYLAFMFVALYFLFLYILIIIRNKHRIFYYPEPKKQYTVSVLTAAYNEKKGIANTVSAIMNSNYKGIIEVIVINDGSTDNTAEIVKKLQKKYKNLKLLDKKENSGKADSLNQGIKIAKGELIAVVDADSYPKKDSIGKMVGFFNDEEMGAVTSAVFVRNKKNLLSKLQQIEYIILAWTRKLLDFLDAVWCTNGPLSIYRKSALKRVGGFYTKTVTEDIELTWHLMDKGYKTRMCLDAFVSTSVPSGFRKWWRQRERWGIGGLQAIYRYKKSFLKKGILGFFVIPFVSFTILFSIFAFSFGFYIILKKFILTYLSTKYSFLANTYILGLQEVSFYPSALIFFLFVLFIISFVYTRYILSILGKRKGEWKEIRKLFNRLIYLLVYVTLYPLIWFSAIYRLIKRDFKW